VQCVGLSGDVVVEQALDPLHQTLSDLRAAVLDELPVPERRIADDMRAYTRDSFMGHYGARPGPNFWERAVPVCKPRLHFLSPGGEVLAETDDGKALAQIWH